MAKCPSSRSRPSTWSALPKDLSEMILSRFDLADHIRFSAVCKWWRSIAAVDNSPINKPLILVRSDHGFRLIWRLFSSFWPSWDLARVLGTFEGWLVLYNDHNHPNRSLFLYNPGAPSPTSTITPLPGFPPPLSDVCFTNRKVVLSSPPSSANCIMVLKDQCGSLAFCKLGVNAHWTYFYHQCPISDIVFYKDQLFAISYEGNLRIFDPANFHPEPINLKRPSKFYPGYSKMFYLAANPSDSDKLFAIKKVRQLDAQLVVSYQVLEVDPRKRGSTSYIKVESLGDNILFLSRFCSLILLAKDYPDLRRNSLYICSEHGYDVFDYSLDDENVVQVHGLERRQLFFYLFGMFSYRKPSLDDIRLT